MRRCRLFLSQTAGFSLISMIVLGTNLLLLLNGMARGEMVPVPVEDLTRYASEIVIGKVVLVSEKTGEFWTQPVTHKTFEFFKATIDVSSVIKGDTTTVGCKCTTLPLGTHLESIYLVGPRCFLSKTG